MWWKGMTRPSSFQGWVSCLRVNAPLVWKVRRCVVWLFSGQVKEAACYFLSGNNLLRKHWSSICEACEASWTLLPWIRFFMLVPSENKRLMEVTAEEQMLTCSSHVSLAVHVSVSDRHISFRPYSVDTITFQLINWSTVNQNHSNKRHSLMTQGSSMGSWDVGASFIRDQCWSLTKERHFKYNVWMM